MNRNQTALLIGVSLICVAFARLIPHPFNFTPLCAMALYGVTYSRNKWLGFLMPLLAIVFSDILVNLTVQKEHTGVLEYFASLTPYSVYASLMLVGALGLFMKKVTAPRVVLFSISGSLLFYLLTNTTSWIIDTGNMYSNDLSGLLQSLYAGIPFYNNEITGSFFLNGIAGDLFFNGLLFGTHALVSKRILNTQTA